MPNAPISGIGTLESISGCPCCDGGGGGGGGDCQCAPCPTFDATEFCFAVTRISLTQADGDCATFDLTLSPTIYIPGMCDGSRSSIAFADFTDHAYAVGDGRTLTIRPTCGISCYQPVDAYRVFFTAVCSLTGCTSFPTNLFQQMATTDDCDLDLLMGSYVIETLLPTTYDLIKVFFTLSHTGTCS